MAISAKFLKQNMRLRGVEIKEIKQITVAGESTSDHQEAVQLISKNRNTDVTIVYSDNTIGVANS